ncbi:mechanosensitive ion channel family protein [Empedobacter brevis]|uniref:mechanosensitive ion channel family protein n=1 Tax=Empedobacter brevis TaxID=247 RepID=UPI0039B06037
MQGVSPKLILAVGVFLIFFIVGRILKIITLRINLKVLSKHPDFVKVFSAGIYFFFLLSGTYLALRILGLEKIFTQALAGAGIIGIIAGFALKDIASNAFSGLLLFFEKPYQTNDWVQIDGHYGVVQKVGWLTTILKSVTGQDVYISNQLTYSGVFINYSKYNTRRVIFQGVIDKDTPPENVKGMITTTITQHENFEKASQIDFYVMSLNSDGGFSVESRFWLNFTTEEAFLETISDIIQTLRKSIYDEKISLVELKWISDESDVTSAGNYGPGG